MINSKMRPSSNKYPKLSTRIARKIKNYINQPLINARELIIGENSIIEPGVEIKCNRLVIGDGVVIKSGTKIDMVDLVIGDYTKINNNCYLTGTNYCRIGHNCWFGHYTVVDSIGSTLIGNNVGVGAHSQLWTHAYFGDVLEGCRFESEKPLVIEDDVWLVGHCIVSPIHAKQRSMAMVGSVITKDMEENHVYAGVPAKDMTERLGPQYDMVSDEDKFTSMTKHLENFIDKVSPKENRIRIVNQLDISDNINSQFSISERLYTKHLHPEEIRFMRYLLPTNAKFLPHPEGDWVSKYLSDLPNKVSD